MERKGKKELSRRVYGVELGVLLDEVDGGEGEDVEGVEEVGKLVVGLRETWRETVRREV